MANASKNFHDYKHCISEKVLLDTLGPVRKAKELRSFRLLLDYLRFDSMVYFKNATSTPRIPCRTAYLSNRKVHTQKK